MFDGYLDECKRGPAQSFVLAKNERKITAHLRVRDWEGHQRLSPNILLNVGAGNETHSHAGGHETFQQFAGIEFHGVVRLHPALVEELSQRVPGMASLGYHQWTTRHFGDGRR